jgi:hypothetical protein
MNNVRTGRFAITGGEAAVNLGVLIAATIAFHGMSRTFSRLKIAVPADGNGGANVAVTNDAVDAPSDIDSTNAAGNNIALGDSREYEQVNLDLVWVYAADDTTVEISGNPA